MRPAPRTSQISASASCQTRRTPSPPPWRTLLAAISWTALFVPPALVAASVAAERERGTLDLLRTAGLSDREVVLGKWAGYGAIAAVYAGKPVDHVISIGSLAAIALPEFVIGSLLIGVFFVGLDWLPPVAIVPPGGNPLDAPEKLVPLKLADEPPP